MAATAVPMIPIYLFTKSVARPQTEAWQPISTRISCWASAVSLEMRFSISSLVLYSAVPRVTFFSSVEILFFVFVKSL